MDELPELDPRVLDLLVEWEEQKAAGSPVTPEELCRDCPERVDELRRRIELIAGLDPLLALSSPGEAERPVIPGFELHEEIGRGGMGVVYKAQDLSLDRVVALKIPFRAAGNLVSRKRFEREVRSLAKLRHPNIVPVYSAGLTDDIPYPVMEYVPGGSLAERVKEVADTPVHAVTLVEKVARAVQAAHAAGIAHRDLKPSNILLNDQGQPLVSDFGVAALLAGEFSAGSSEETPDDRHPAQTRLTRTGVVAGTPAYSAPEHAGEPVTAAADVWSMGVILHELLTGERPSQAKPPDPNAVAKAIPGRLGRQLTAVVLRCLRQQPNERYATADEFADALIVAVRPSRRNFLLAVGVAGTVALAGGIPVSLFMADPYRRFCWRTRSLTRRLERGEVIEVVDPNGTREPDFFLTVGHGTTGTEFLDRAWVVSSTAFSLLELLPRLPLGVEFGLRSGTTTAALRPTWT